MLAPTGWFRSSSTGAYLCPLLVSRPCLARRLYAGQSGWRPIPCSRPAGQSTRSSSPRQFA